MKVRVTLVVALLGWAVLAETSPASAQAVTLEFRNGRVSLSAQNAPLRTILAEWTRLGGTKIVNGDRMAGAPLTLELVDVTERQAVDVLLRGAAGYFAGPRAAGSTGASTFESIMIIPTSAAVRPAQAAQAPAGGTRPGTRETAEPDDSPENVFADDPSPSPSPADAAAAVAEEAQRRVAERRAQIFIGDQAVEQQQPGAARPNQPATTSNPFGIAPGAARPGVITAPSPQTPETRRRQADN
jgi:hypothetical protein